MSLPYRRDVDGLRAVAVLFVVGFHYFPSIFPGGFVGVDVFFVISGFLITSLIHQDIAAGRFSIAEFYGRRIRRIFPALILVLLVSLGAGFLFMLPEAYRALGLNTAASAGFVANIALYLQQDYFAPSAELNPLLHIWSLGVEEQFYLFWPLILMVLARRRVAIPGAIGLTVLSFIGNIVQTASDPVASFFLPFSRFWELGAGAVLALLQARAGHFIRGREWMGWGGLLLLALAMVAIDRDRAFPGWWALVPVAGTVLLIASGEKARANRFFLSHRTMVYIGLISYPLYLWHWPLLAFARIIRFGKEPTILMSIGLIIAAGLLAHLTYKFVERPIRLGERLSVKAALLATLLIVSGGMGLAVYAKDGLPDRFPPEIQKRVMSQNSLEDVRACTFNPRVPLPAACDGEGPAGTPLVLVWGDSYGIHLVAGLRDLQQRQNFRLARSFMPGCPPMAEAATAAQHRDCNEANAFARHRIELLRPDTVIIAARWAIYGGRMSQFPQIGDRELSRTIEWLKAAGVQNIVVLGQFPHWQLAPSVIPLRNFQLGIFRNSTEADKIPDWDSVYLDVSAFAAEEMVNRVAAAEGVTFISPAATLCKDGSCLITVPDSDGMPTSRDDGHLTPAASRFFIAENANAIRPDYRKQAPPQ